MKQEIIRLAIDEIKAHKNRSELAVTSKTIELENSMPEFRAVMIEQRRLGAEYVRNAMQGENPYTLAERFEERANALEARKIELLSSIGKASDYLTPKYFCKICEDSTRVDGKICACVHDRATQKLYENLNKELGLGLMDFSSFSLEYYSVSQDKDTGLVPYQKMKENFEYSKKFAEQFAKTPPSKTPNILMMGSTGLGKTHLSLSIAKEVIKDGFQVIYGSAPNLISKIEQEKFSGRGDSGKTLDLLLGCDLLILDDLGTEFQTQFTLSVIYNLINTRINKGLPTIISTNLSYKELENAYSARILSRLTGTYDTLFFVGEDIRIKKRRDEF